MATALETYRDAAITALEAGDYATAISKALAAKMMLATTANAQRGASGNTQQLTWDRMAIDQFIKDCRLLQSQAAHATGGPLRTTQITYERCDTSGDYE